jgi:hypothetical protein
MGRLLAPLLLVALSACDGCEQSSPPSPSATRPAASPSGPPTTVSPRQPALTSEAHVASADRRCRAPCKIGGLCGWDDEAGRCKARNEEDCAKSDSCTTSGLCHFDSGLCAGQSEADCRQSEQCKAAGRCSFTGKGLRPCEAKTKEDCAASEMCKRKGECTPEGGRCRVSSVEDCEGSELCTKHGLCSTKEISMGGVAKTICIAGSNDDCARAEICKEQGLCMALAGSCQ